MIDVTGGAAIQLYRAAQIDSLVRSGVSDGPRILRANRHGVGSAGHKSVIDGKLNHIISGNIGDEARTRIGWIQQGCGATKGTRHEGPTVGERVTIGVKGSRIR